MTRVSSFAASARRSPLRMLAIGVIASAVAIAMSGGASAAGGKGVWGVSGGKTLRLTNMTIDAGDTDNAYIWVDGVQFDQLGTNSGNEGTGPVSLSDYTYTPTDGRHHTVTVEIRDTTAGNCGFFSDGSNAVSTRTSFGINDGGGVCQSDFPPPGPGLGNFVGTVSVARAA